MLNERLLEHIKELSMDVRQIKETKASRAFRLYFEANGKREALFAVLAARGLTPPPAEHERLAALTDVDVLDRCLQAAATCTSLDTVLQLLPGRPRAPRRSPNSPRPRTAKVDGRRR